MSAAYLWLKAIHVIAVAIWFGAGVTVLGITGIMQRTSEKQRLAALAGAAEFAALRLIAPSGGTAFIAGIATMVIGHLTMQLWILWGFIAGIIVLSAGGIILGRGHRKLVTLLAQPTVDDAAVAAMIERLRSAGIVALLILSSAMIVMVLKPA